MLQSVIVIAHAYDGTSITHFPIILEITSAHCLFVFVEVVHKTLGYGYIALFLKLISKAMRTSSSIESKLKHHN